MSQTSWQILMKFVLSIILRHNEELIGLDDLDLNFKGTEGPEQPNLSQVSLW